jgi:hypothetical protein
MSRAPRVRQYASRMRVLLPTVGFVAIFCLAMTGLAPEASGFGTLNELGQRVEHERITRAALGDLGARTLDELAGATGAYGAVGAPDNPLRGLLVTSEAHCDNGDYYAPSAADLSSTSYSQTRAQAEHALELCRAWITRRLDDAVRAAGPLSHPGRINSSLGCVFNGAAGRAKCTVLENFGLALHAAQDFYAHTNWVDRPAAAPLGLENPPGLANEGRAAWLDPRRATPFPPGLISGCFQSVPEKLFCASRVRHAALNKDLGPIGVGGLAGQGATPRGAVNGNFQRAVAAAIDDTRDKWAYFEERVYAAYGRANGARIICAVRSDTYKGC